MAPPPAADPIAPPRLAALTPPPLLLPPSAPPGSLGPPAPPRADVTHPAPWTYKPSAALHPYSSVWFRLPSGYALALSRSSFASAPRFHLRGSSLQLRRSHRSLRGRLGPPALCLHLRLGHRHGCVKEIPAMSFHPGWTLGCHLAPPAPGFSLALPTICNTLVYPVITSPGFLSSTYFTSSTSASSLVGTVSARSLLSGRGRTVTIMFSLSLFSVFAFFLPVSLVISWLVSRLISHSVQLCRFYHLCLPPLNRFYCFCSHLSGLVYV